ncbi:MAG: glutamine amidotransferase [Saprospiraceae bacterium]|nr:glutamine amidotransferase [Saprospiraceae bacterium]
MKKLLILQMRPEDITAESEFEAILRVGEIDRKFVRRIRVEQLKNIDINIDDYSAIIAGGSPFDISIPASEKSDIQNYVEAFFNRLFQKLIPEDFPFLGACSGNGLLGNYCGTEISGKYAEPIGNVKINITEEGKKDPLLKGFPNSFKALVGHKEACDDVPCDAVLLATSKSCPVQMFRIKNNIYATQFHPEADEDEFKLRIRTYKDYGYFKPEEADVLIAKIKGTKTPFPKIILRRFINIYHH